MSISEYGKKVSKNDNYERIDIQKLRAEYGEKALIITCRYIPNNRSDYLIFGNIRVFDESKKTKTKYQLTDHVNFPKSIISRFIKIDERDMRRKKFFAVCIPVLYNHYGIIRGEFKLVIPESGSPIMRAPEKQWEWEEELNRLINLRNIYNRQYGKLEVDISDTQDWRPDANGGDRQNMDN